MGFEEKILLGITDYSILKKYYELDLLNEYVKVLTINDLGNLMSDILSKKVDVDEDSDAILRVLTLEFAFRTVLINKTPERQSFIQSIGRGDRISLSVIIYFYKRKRLTDYLTTLLDEELRKLKDKLESEVEYDAIWQIRDAVNLELTYRENKKILKK